MNELRRKELFDELLSWVFEHSDECGNTTYAMALKECQFTYDEIEDELGKCCDTKDEIEKIMKEIIGDNMLYFYNLKRATLFYTGGGVYLMKGELEKVIESEKEKIRQKCYFYGEFDGLMVVKDYQSFLKLSDPTFANYDELDIDYLDSETSLEIARDVIEYKAKSQNINDDDNFDLHECENILGRKGE